jgi:hypothetical protein
MFRLYLKLFRNRDKIKDDAITQLSDQLLAISTLRESNQSNVIPTIWSNN